MHCVVFRLLQYWEYCKLPAQAVGTQDRASDTPPLAPTYKIEKTDMKATLLALMTLGSLAMAAEEPQTLTIVPSTPPNAKGGDYDAIVFTLTNGGSRTSVVGEAALTPTVILDSIQLAGRNEDLGVLAGWCPIITDATETVIGFSMTPSTTVKTTHADDWGLAYTRSWATLTGFANADLKSEVPLTLNLNQEYRLYLGTQDQVYDLFQALFGPSYLDADPVKITSAYYTSRAIKVTTAGEYGEASAAELGFMNDGSPVGPTWAPMMGITVQNNNVPEPTTGTLSLLALAGLCIRRRK